MISESAAMNAAVYEALCACFGLSPESAAASALIQPAYSEPENAPRPPRERNVVYYWLEREDAPNDLAQMQVQEAGQVRILSFLAYRLQIVCYGSRAEEHAHRIRTMMYLDGAGKPRGILRAAGIYPIPRPAQPAILREPEGSLWRRRADLTISLRVKDSLTATQATINNPPEIEIQH